MLSQAQGQCMQVTRRQVSLHHWDGTIPEAPAATERSTREAFSGRTVTRLCLKTETGPRMSWGYDKSAQGRLEDLAEWRAEVRVPRGSNP